LLVFTFLSFEIFNDQSFLKTKTPINITISVNAGKTLQNANIHQNNMQSQTSVIKYERQTHPTLCDIEANESINKEKSFY
jgi:hypothetical protein